MNSGTMFIFGMLVVLMAGTMALAWRRARFGWPFIAGLGVLYLVIPGALARAHLLDGFDPLPAPALLIIAFLLLLTLVLACSVPGSRIAASVPLGAIVLLQGFRVVVEIIIHRLHREGFIPEQMTFVGRNFDVITGISAILLGGLLLSGRHVPRAVVWGWNILGLGLLLNIVVIAVLSTPVPFRVFLHDPPNLLASTFPYVWLPSFLVQVAVGSHVLIFRKLVRGER